MNNMTRSEIDRAAAGAVMRTDPATRTALYEWVDFSSGFAARTAAMLPVLVLPMAAFGRLGTERVGVLLTTVSLLGVVAMADLGASASVLTRVARHAAGDNARHGRRAQAQAIALAATMGCATAIVGVAIACSDIGKLVFPRSSPAIQQESTLAIAIFVITNALHLPMQVTYRIRHALHEGHFANAWQAAAAVVNFAVALTCLYCDCGVPTIVAALMCGSLGLGLTHMALHLQRNRGVRVELLSTGSRRTLAFARYSLPYFGTQVIFAIAFSLDALVVAMLLGAESAAQYAIADRIFSTITVLVSIRTLRLWAIFASFVGQEKRGEAVRLLRKEAFKLSMIALTVATALVIAFPMLSSRFGLHASEVTITTLIGLALWRVIESAGNAIATFIYSAEAAHFVVAIGAVTAILALTMKYILCQRFGISAVPFSMSVVYIGCSMIPCVLFIRSWAAPARAPGPST
jgi:O-antigen/teichoic acid export membrane protein